MSNQVALNKKFAAYPEYKDSGIEWVGDIPIKWNVLPAFAVLREECIRNLDGAETNVLSLSYGSIKQRDVESNAGLLPESFNTYQLVNYGDIVLRLTDLQNDKRSLRVGRSTQKGIITSAYMKLVCRHQLDNRFVYQLLHSYDTTKVFYGMGGGLRQSMKFEDFRRLPVIVPPLEEQRTIAAFLDYETTRIDQLIAKQQRLIELLKEKRQTVLSHAVTKGLNPNVPMKVSGVEWLGQVPEHWVATPLKHYAKVIDCKHITAEFTDQGFPLASISEVKGWSVNLVNAKRTSTKFYEELIEGGRKPRPGDIIYSRNATVGEAALVTEDMPDFAMGQDVCLIRLCDSLESEFLLYVLKSGVIETQLSLAMVGSTFKRINVDNIRNFLLALPPKSEQKAIVKTLSNLTSKYDSLVFKAQLKIGLMQERRTALISAAVTGKIDLRGWTPPKEG